MYLKNLLGDSKYFNFFNIIKITKTIIILVSLHLRLHYKVLFILCLKYIIITLFTRILFFHHPRNCYVSILFILHQGLKGQAAKCHVSGYRQSLTSVTFSHQDKSSALWKSITDYPSSYRHNVPVTSRLEDLWTIGKY